LFRLQPRFQGVLLEYSNLVHSGPGACVDDQWDVLFRFTADLLVFAPEPGTVLTCTVAEMFASHIALTTMGAFRVVVAADKVAKGFRWNNKKKIWMNGSEELARDSEIQVSALKLAGSSLAWQVEASMI